ncbi:response regulator [Aliidongia dinghuensis]|uniref:Response regulator n=1 Tax=Aliidongia dinghuensis TaxID=1867774 RepID=A0A8J2YX97_9PROT|nr:response regulator [Aliidongia dinghuensis]GGF33895.1 response regulator [Aliidongia dinghuensis]
MTSYEAATALIVEDNPHTRSLIKRMLLQVGVRSVVEAADGQSGLLEVMRTRPDIVFCDVHMEPVDGRAFLRAVRESKLPAIRQTPIVFLTGDAHQNVVEFAKEHAVNGYLVKPVSPADLKRRLDSILGRD